jgi:hypothetical protein
MAIAARAQPATTCAAVELATGVVRIEMADEQQQNSKEPGFVKTITKRALAPVVATAATAATGYSIRKGTELWEQKLRPKLQEKGGGLALARETLENAAARVGGPVSEKMSGLADKVGANGGGQDSTAAAPKDLVSNAEREQERRQRKQRRQERRQALERAKPS